MKILSITDVITNSSSEVFTIVHPEDVNRIKEVINLILKLGNSNKTCDDLFEIEFKWDEAELRECMELKDFKTLDEAKQACLDDIECGGAPPYTLPEITIHSKLEINSIEQILLNNVSTMFADTLEFYS